MKPFRALQKVWDGFLGIEGYTSLLRATLIRSVKIACKIPIPECPIFLLTSLKDGSIFIIAQ